MPRCQRGGHDPGTWRWWREPDGCFGSGGVGIEGANIPDRGGNFRSRKAPERQTGVSVHSQARTERLRRPFGRRVPVQARGFPKRIDWPVKVALARGLGLPLQTQGTHKPLAAEGPCGRIRMAPEVSGVFKLPCPTPDKLGGGPVSGGKGPLELESFEQTPSAACGSSMWWRSVPSIGLGRVRGKSCTRAVTALYCVNAGLKPSRRWKFEERQEKEWEVESSSH